LNSNLQHAFRTIIARAYPRIIGSFRHPSWFLFEVGLPVLSIITFVYVLKLFDSPKEYESYAIIGGCMLPIWFNVVFAMALQLRWEKDSGNLEIFMTSPAKMTWILLGMMVGGSIGTILMAASVFLITTTIFDITFLWENWWKALIVFIPCVLSLYSIGMAMSSVFLKAGRAFEYYLGLAEEPIQFITGSYFPIFSQNILLAIAGSIVPLTLGIDGLRQVLVVGAYVSPIDWKVESLVMFIYWIVGLRLAKLSLNWMEKLAREQGTLTLRWQ